MTERVTSRFGHASTAMEVVAGIDLRGKNAIVTGAASGIGSRRRVRSRPRALR